MVLLGGYDPEVFVQSFSQSIREWQGDRTNESAAELLKISKSTLNRWKSGENLPDARQISHVCDLLKVDPNSLFGVSKGPIVDRMEFNIGSIFQIPILDVNAGAGDGVDNGDAEIVAHLPFPVGFLHKLSVKPERVRAVRVHGDSMEPTIPNGMLVLINTAAADLQDGRIYALRAPDGLRLKRIQRQIDGSVTLISDNRDKYLPETLSPEEAMSVEVAGHAFWTERLI